MPKAPDTVQYFPKSQKDTLLPKTVLEIIEIAHKKNPKPGQKGTTNHWAFYLVVSPKQSVRVDCTPSGLSGTSGKGTMKATIVISGLEYTCSTNTEAASKTSLKPAKKITVKNVVDLITSKGLDKYDFNAQGTGCRFWNTRVLDEMAKAGMAAPADVAKAKASILKLWPTGTALPLDQGVFTK